MEFWPTWSPTVRNQIRDQSGVLPVIRFMLTYSDFSPPELWRGILDQNIMMYWWVNIFFIS
jgi:hypothetical protein